MPLPDIQWGRLPFAEAIAYLAQKTNTDTQTWLDIASEEHDSKFVVAGAKGALLQDLREAVEAAIAEGITIQEFRQRFSSIVEARGWTHTGQRDWRARIIYNTNVRTAYAAGRYAQQHDPDVKRLQPYGQWVHGDSPHARPAHLALDGRVFSLDDPFWLTNYCPNGYGCKCRVRTLSDRQLERRSLKVEKGPVDGTEEIVTLPGGKKANVRWGPDPGFEYAPGRSVAQRVREDALKRLSPDIREAVEREADGSSDQVVSDRLKSRA